MSLIDQRDLGVYYDGRYAGDYMSEWPAAEQQRVRELLAEVPSGITKLLDYGCGQGAWLELLGSRFPDAHITGIDISEHAVAKARLRCPGACLLAFDGGQAPLEAEAFDLVFSFHVLEHVWDIDVTVADMARLVKKGGYVCAVFPCGNPGSFEERLVALVRGGVEQSATGECRFFYDDPGHLRRMTTQEIVDRFAAQGLTPVRELFGNQVWGSIDWIARTGGAWVRQMFDPARAAGWRAKIKLRALRLVFLILSPAVKLASARGLRAELRANHRRRSRLLLATAVVLKPLTAPVGDFLERAAENEWRKRSHNPAASAQYLVFRRA